MWHRNVQHERNFELAVHSLMKLAIELEFPAEDAALALQWLQSVPRTIVTRLQGRSVTFPTWRTNAAEPLTEEERRTILSSFAEPLLPGEETAEEMERRIYGDRRDDPREVEL